MGKIVPNEDLFAEYRRGTRQPAPSHFAEAVRHRLATSSFILPRVAFLALATTITITTTTSFFLTTTTFQPQVQNASPPPLFQPAPGDLFHEMTTLSPK